MQAPLIGTPNDATLGLDTLLYALTAAVVSRMERFGVALAAGMGIGVLITATIINSGDNSISSSVMVLVILGALLTQPRRTAHALDAGEGRWQTVKQYRPIPADLRKLPEVAGARWGMVIVGAGFMIALPYILGVDNVSYLILLPLYGIVAVSLVVLTGWAGQISLGQFGLVGASAGVAGGLVANHNIDFFAALGIGILTGVVAAVIIGLPSLRIQGLYLAVTTLAFGYAVPNYLLNGHYWIGAHILPSGLSAHLSRPVLYGRIDLSGDRTFYFVCLVFLAIAMVAALAFRRNRSGRVLTRCATMNAPPPPSPSTRHAPGWRRSPSRVGSPASPAYSSPTPSRTSCRGPMSPKPASPSSLRWPLPASARFPGLWLVPWPSRWLSCSAPGCTTCFTPPRSRPRCHSC